MKPMDVGGFFNRRVIISVLGAHLNNDDTIGASGIAEGQIETAVVAKVVKNQT